VRLVETVVDGINDVHMCLEFISFVRDDWQGQEVFLFYKASRPALAPTQPPHQWVPVAPVGTGEPKLKVLNKFENTGFLY
jgi:hypothetical protein